MERVRLAVLDMDGTLLEERSSWAKIHHHFGTTEVGLRGFEQFERGLIDYDQFMEHDVAAWPSGTRLSDIDRILSDYTLKRDAKETVNRLRKSARVVMVSAGLDVLAKRVALDLGIEHWVAGALPTKSLDLDYVKLETGAHGADLTFGIAVLMILAFSVLTSVNYRCEIPPAVIYLVRVCSKPVLLADRLVVDPIEVSPVILCRKPQTTDFLEIRHAETKRSTGL